MTTPMSTSRPTRRTPPALISSDVLRFSLTLITRYSLHSNISNQLLGVGEMNIMGSTSPTARLASTTWWSTGERFRLVGTLTLPVVSVNYDTLSHVPQIPLEP